MEHRILGCAIQLAGERVPIPDIKLRLILNIGVSVVELWRHGLQHLPRLHQNFHTTSRSTDLPIRSSQLVLVAYAISHRRELNILHNLLLCTSIPLLSTG